MNDLNKSRLITIWSIFLVLIYSYIIYAFLFEDNSNPKVIKSEQQNEFIYKSNVDGVDQNVSISGEGLSVIVNGKELK